MNRMTICGRLTKDPVQRETNSGMKVTRYTVAVDRRKNRDGSDGGADYFNCVAWDARSDFPARYFTKGMRVLISGHVQTGSYTNKDGQKVPTWDIFVDEQEFADGRQNGGTAPQRQTQRRQEEPEEWMRIPGGADSEGLPFN